MSLGWYPHRNPSRGGLILARIIQWAPKYDWDQQETVVPEEPETPKYESVKKKKAKKKAKERTKNQRR